MNVDWGLVGAIALGAAAVIAAVAGGVAAYFAYLAVVQQREYREDARLEQVGFRLVELAEPPEGVLAVTPSGWSHRGAMLHVLTVGDPRLPKCRALAEEAAQSGTQPDALLLDAAWSEWEDVFIARFPDRAPHARRIWDPNR